MFKPISRRLRKWHLGAFTRWRLGLLDDRLLNDIGTSRDDLERFVTASLKSEDLQ